MTVISRAEVRVPAANLSAFTEIARQLAAAGAAEPGTVQYRWFTSDDPSVFVAIEEYADEQAAFAHNQACADLLGKLFGVAEMTSVQIYGELGPDLREWIAAQPQARGYGPLPG